MATEIETAQAQLVKVRAAIDTVLTSNQSVSVLGRTWTRAELSDLRAMERDLIARVGRLERGGVKIQRVVPL